MKWSYKKKLKATERNEIGREAFKVKQQTIDTSNIVIIDESGSNLALTRLYGWGPTKARVYQSVPRNWG
jgi:hypothetical protein